MTVKESIERCKQIVKDNNEIIKEARKNGDINTMNLTASLDNDSIAIDTVIQALEQKDKELAEERIKYISSNLNNTIKQRQKEDEQLNALNEGWKIELEQKDKEIQELKADLYECNNIISDYIDTVKEKDKIIDLMAKYFYDTDSLCVKDETEVNCNHHCVKCIKQYFKEKAREENE